MAPGPPYLYLISLPMPIPYSGVGGDGLLGGGGGAPPPPPPIHNSTYTAAANLMYIKLPMYLCLFTLIVIPGGMSEKVDAGSGSEPKLGQVRNDKITV